MSAPQFESVDNYTADLLDLVARAEHPSADHEWQAFVEALIQARSFGGVIKPNDLRPMVRGVVAPNRIGAFTHRALSQGLVEYNGEWQVSNDTAGRNSGKPARVMRWIGAAHVESGAA